MQAKLTMGAFAGMLFLHCFVNPGPLRTCIPLLLPQEINVFIGDQRVVQLSGPIFCTNAEICKM